MPPERRHVLAITADAKLGLALVAALEREGYIVTVAAHVHDALSLASRARPDAVVCDVDLPDRHGIELIRRIRREQGDVPFVVLHASEARGGFAGIIDDLSRSIRPPAPVPTTSPALPAAPALSPAAAVASAAPAAASTAAASPGELVPAGAPATTLAPAAQQPSPATTVAPAAPSLGDRSVESTLVISPAPQTTLPVIDALPPADGFGGVVSAAPPLLVPPPPSHEAPPSPSPGAARAPEPPPSAAAAALAAPRPGGPSGAAQPPPLPRPVRVAIVDEDPSVETAVRQAAVRAFGVTGASVTRYPSALAALRALALEPPHVIVFEITLPDLDGVTFVRTLRRSPRLSAVHTIAATRNPHWHTLTVLLDAGADAYVFKPITQEVLARTMSDLLRRAQGPDR